MKKLAIAVLAILFVAPSALAEGWGVGVKLGAGENEPKGMEDAFHDLGGTLDKNESYLGVEVLYEWDLNDEANKIGLKAGWDMYGENELKPLLPGEKITETTYAFPVTVYYKRDNGVKHLSWWAGAGATFLRTEVEASGSVMADHNQNKVFPHVAAGAEYRFTHLFALGLEARYNIDAKVEEDGAIFSDRSGFGAAVTGRFYF